MIALKNKDLFRQACFINGQWETHDKTFNIYNPATGELLGELPDFGKSETEKAILSAEKAFELWREKTAKERAFILRKWYELILENSEDLACILTSEQGKSLKEARGEIQYGVAFVEWFAEEAKRLYGDVIPVPVKDHHHIVVIKQPIGVVGAITPWNFPCATITRKCASALAAGCTVVPKPSSLTPFTALALAVLAERAGMPPGVMNIITGNASQIGEALATSKIIRKISFTGSTEIGKLLMQQAAHDEAEAIRMANDTPFGLASYFYSQTLSRIWRVSEKLEYGMVGINSGIISTEGLPFGGVKESGIGREGSKYGIEEFIEIKSLYMGAT